MDSFAQLFEMAVARLGSVGIAAQLERGGPVTAQQIARYERDWATSIPQSIRQFYFDVGDGLEFRWFIDRLDALSPFCWLKVPQLSDLKGMIDYLHMLNDCLADHEFREARQPERAIRHYRRQLTFFPFLQDNADLMCVEVCGEREQVVFHDHEWSFHEDGDSGLILAPSLLEFWQGWSNVGFVQPTQLWWPGTIKGQATEWSIDRFGFSPQKLPESADR
jgi:hypothetical protein